MKILCLCTFKDFRQMPGTAKMHTKVTGKYQSYWIASGQFLKGTRLANVPIGWAC
jgi:hypothetical protein